MTTLSSRVVVVEGCPAWAGECSVRIVNIVKN